MDQLVESISDANVLKMHTCHPFIHKEKNPIANNNIIDIVK
jgi:hypothetical protein